jgi:hypothetical protein
MNDLEFLVRERQEEYLKEAARYRLISQARQRTASLTVFYAPALTWLGALLSKWGNLLQEQFGEA